MLKPKSDRFDSVLKGDQSGSGSFKKSFQFGPCAPLVSMNFEQEPVGSVNPEWMETK